MSEKDFNHLEHLTDQFVMKLDAEFGYYQFNLPGLSESIVNLIADRLK